MLEYFRNAAKSWVAKILLSLLVLSFAVWGINDIFFSGLWGKDLATVGHQKITGTAYTQAFNRAVERYSQQAGTQISLDEARALGIDRQVRDGLIATAALDSLATDLGVKYGHEQIAAEVAANPMFQDSNGKFDVEIFNRALANSGLNETSYISSEQTSKIRLALTSAASLKIVPNVLLDAQRLFREEKRTARYVRFTVNAADIAAPTDDELKTYFKDHAGNYVDPEYRSVVIMKAEPQDVAAKLAVSDQELADTYAKFKTDYFTPETRNILQLSFPDEAAAQKARQRVLAGEEFSKIASESGAKESDITLANKTKADLLDPVIAEAAFNLAKAAVSEPVKGGLATVLLKVTAIEPEKQATLDEVKEQVKSRVQAEKARDELQSVSDAVEDARAEQTKFEDIAAKAGIPITVIPAINSSGLDRNGQAVPLPAVADLVKAIFGSDVGVENDALTLPEGYVWYDVREVIPSAPQKLDDIKQTVIADWNAQKIRAAAEDKAKKLLARAKAGENLDTFAKELGTVVKDVKPLSRVDGLEDFDSASVAALFTVPLNGKTYALEGDGVSARIIEVTKLEMPSPPTLDEKQQKTEMRNALTSDMAQAYLAAVRASTDVSINEDLWKTIDGAQAQQ